MGKIRQMIKQFENAAELESCRLALQDAIDRLKVSPFVPSGPNTQTQ
jgi:hypothetical protein